MLKVRLVAKARCPLHKRQRYTGEGKVKASCMTCVTLDSIAGELVSVIRKLQDLEREGVEVEIKRRRSRKKRAKEEVNNEKTEVG
jgi:hypothetical protein